MTAVYTHSSMLQSFGRLVHKLQRSNLLPLISGAGRSASSYAKLSDDDVNAFQNVLGENGVIQDETALEAANEYAEFARFWARS